MRASGSEVTSVTG